MLTNTQIRALKPAAQPYKVPDRDGLFLLVQPTGALLWRFRFKILGVERKLSLGSYPDVSLKEARLKRDEARAQVIDGIDPVEEKRQRRIEAELAAKTTFKLVAEEYIQKMEMEGRSPATIKKARWFLELLSDIAKRPIASVSPHELLDVLKRVERRGHHETPANMRAKGKPDIASILPSVRARGVLVPLIVRQNGSADTYEIVAGKRRYHAALAAAEGAGECEPLPCAVIAAGDDAAALETSLIENVARLDPDEVTRWESFTRLVREGRSVEDIAQTFGITELQVKRTLALGNLLPRIRTLYRRGEIDAATVRHMTLASKARQRDWLALLDDESAYCPTGYSLKSWLFGGTSIAVSAAIFDLNNYPGAIVSDLFGDERYFADADTFWRAQLEAVEGRAASYRDAGWAVEVMPVGDPFHGWEYERTAKRKGGRVYIAIGSRGDVAVHEGYLPLREVAKRERGEVVEKPVRPEISAAIGTYCDLHRHAAVRSRLADRPWLALRVMVAHVISGSPLWSVRVEPQRAHNDAIAESVENSASEAAFDEKRRAVLALLGFDPDTPTVVHGDGGEHGIAGLFAKLLALPDTAVLDALAIIMGETLAVGTPLVEMLGQVLAIDLADLWQADDALLDLIRDREVLGSILTEVAGEQVAQANAKATGKVKRSIIRDCLTGENGRTKVERWIPRWMAFPPSGYTDRGGVVTVDRAAGLPSVTITAATIPANDRA